MRFLSLLAAVVILPATGCSALIVGSGKDLAKLSTRAQVREVFGEPLKVEQADGATVDEFVTRKKIAEPYKEIYLSMGYVMTLGLGEIIWFPHQSFISLRRCVVGQRVRYKFDGDGNVTAIDFDGEPISLPPR